MKWNTQKGRLCILPSDQDCAGGLLIRNAWNKGGYEVWNGDIGRDGDGHLGDGTGQKNDIAASGDKEDGQSFNELPIRDSDEDERDVQGASQRGDIYLWDDVSVCNEVVDQLVIEVAGANNLKPKTASLKKLHFLRLYDGAKRGDGVIGQNDSSNARSSTKV